jgi:hypothetical protein
MGARRRSESAGSSASADSPRSSARRDPDDDRFNDEVNDLLRTAAEDRERQLRALAADDATRARLAFDAVVTLARKRNPEASTS